MGDTIFVLSLERFSYNLVLYGSIQFYLLCTICLTDVLQEIELETAEIIYVVRDFAADFGIFSDDLYVEFHMHILNSYIEKRGPPQT